ncbi:hypothetical protein [Bacillus benzoevorans]|nr:hypothetical protein [Bacillus benzoevorans]
MLYRNLMESDTYHQRFFRPSCLPALNMRFAKGDFFQPYFEKTFDQINVPIELARTPEDTVINYFSILREASYMGERSCGTIGQSKIPYPLAYNFFTKEYQQKISYENYLHSFAGVGHTSLIKLCRIPDENQGIKFFYEIETIEGFEGRSAEYFGYSYGFLQLVQEHEGFRISDLHQIEEDFLCAPYHGWDQDGESIVDIKYGEWCKLVKKRYPTIRNGYIKNIYFRGHDETNYLFIYFTLTNGTDIEIAQFHKAADEKWKQIKINPEQECITQKNE